MREWSELAPFPSALKFIRWLKNHLDLERDWGRAMARLNEIYAHL